jgi:hypothetical protein
MDGATFWSAVGAIGTCVAAVVAILSLRAARAPQTPAEPPPAPLEPAMQPRKKASLVPAAAVAPPPESSPQTGPVKPPVPSFAESERSSQIRFAIGVRQLLEWHEMVAKCAQMVENSKTNVLLLGLGIGVVGGLVGFFTVDLGLSISGAVVGFAGTVWISEIWFKYLGTHWREAKGNVAAKIDELFTTLPRECETWGGRTALADRETVKAILRELDAQEQ